MKDKLREAEALTKALPASAQYEKDFWTFAGYDSPFKLMNRHNEIWLIAKSETSVPETSTNAVPETATETAPEISE